MEQIIPATFPLSSLYFLLSTNPTFDLPKDDQTFFDETISRSPRKTPEPFKRP